jgi:hypothetical protein
VIPGGAGWVDDATTTRARRKRLQQRQAGGGAELSALADEDDPGRFGRGVAAARSRIRWVKTVAPPLN